MLFCLFLSKGCSVTYSVIEPAILVMNISQCKQLDLNSLKIHCCFFMVDCFNFIDENVTPGISLPNWDDFDCEPHGFPRSISQIKLVAFDCSFSIVRVSD